MEHIWLISVYFHLTTILHTCNRMANAQIAQVDVSFVPSIHGGEILHIGGFRFWKKSQRGERIYWSCAESGCGSRATTLTRILVHHRDNHTHAADVNTIKAKEVIQNIRKRCREEINPIPSIYDEEIARLRGQDWDDDDGESKDIVRQTPTFQSCKSTLYNERSKIRPVLPKSADVIKLDGEWTQTSSGNKFLQIDTNENNTRLLVFSTRENLQHLCNMQVVYGDGTFYTCPGLFYQLFTLHGFVDGIMYPLVFAFLTGKSADIYESFLTQLKDKCAEYGFHLQPDSYFLDHELASRNAVFRVFPNTTVKACFFHYTQCIWRKVQSLGLAKMYKENDNMHQLVRRASVLPLIPRNAVEDVWFEALESVAEADLPVDTSSFADYVTETWVDSDKSIWNHFETVGPRTTNHLEGWHSKLKKVVGHAHPNIFKIIAVLKNIEAVCCIRIVQYQAGGARPVKRGKYRQIEYRLSVLKTRLQDGLLSMVEYADEAAKLLHM